jgi:hypothetical protein
LSIQAKLFGSKAFAVYSSILGVPHFKVRQRKRTKYDLGSKYQLIYRLLLLRGFKGLDFFQFMLEVSFAAFLPLQIITMYGP